MLRSAPWLPLTAGSCAGLGLLLTAALAPTAAFVPFAVMVGLAACGGAAAYVLDEAAAPVLDATPTSRGVRTGLRLLLLAVPAVAASAGLTALDRADAAGGWLHLLPVAAGSIAVGAALAAVLRRSNSTPGDLASAITVATVLLTLVVDPLRHWLTLLPIGDARVGPAATAWAFVVVAAAALLAWCARDPGRQGATVGFGLIRNQEATRSGRA